MIVIENSQEFCSVSFVLINGDILTCQISLICLFRHGMDGMEVRSGMIRMLKDHDYFKSKLSTRLAVDKVKV